MPALGYASGPWEDAHAGFWGDAVRGNSALRTGLQRALLDEVAATTGIDAAAVYFDLEKFYDQIALGMLCEAGLRLDYPSLALSSSVQAFLGCRRLRAHGGYSEQILPSSSLAAGCRRSNSLARVMLHDLLAEAHRRFPLAGPRQNVDDIAQRAEGTIRLLARVVPPAVQFLTQGLIGRGLPISTSQTKLLGSSPDATRAAIAAQRGLGFELKAANGEVRDLGVGQLGGRLRASALSAQRIQLALRRSRRALLFEAHGGSHKLFSTGSLPQACYGAACGIAPRPVESLRAAAARALVAGQAAGRATSALALCCRKGANLDPAVKIRALQVQTWCSVWSGLTAVRRQHVERAWCKELARLQVAGRWRLVRGPMGATIATLLDLDRRPTGPREWMDHDGITWFVDDVGARLLLHRAVETSATRRLRRAAGRYHAGAGLQGGVDLIPRHRMHRRFLSRQQPGAAAMLMAIARGAFWGPERRFRAGLADEHRCPRCLAPHATDARLFWSCPVHQSSAIPAAREAQHLLPLVDPSRECLWLRGLCPGADVATEQSPPAGSTQARFEQGIAVATVRSNTLRTLPARNSYLLFTDGSGGPSGTDPRLRC